MEIDNSASDSLSDEYNFSNNDSDSVEIILIDSNESSNHEINIFENSTTKSVSSSSEITLKEKKSPEIPFNFGNCKICNDKASGIHYGLATCEGCKVKILIIVNFLFKP